jgi:hypothetical protein
VRERERVLEKDTELKIYVALLSSFYLSAVRTFFSLLFFFVK